MTRLAPVDPGDDMAFTQQTLTVSLSAGIVTIAIGAETITLPLEEVRAIHRGRRDVSMLLYQMVRQCQASGLDITTATNAQIKAAVEAGTYFWGNG